MTNTTTARQAMEPVTAAGNAESEAIPVPVDVPPGFWEREASHAPLPHSPMNRSLFFENRNRALANIFTTYGLFAEALELREIGGWEYARIVPLGGKEPPAMPPWLSRVMIRLHPEMRRRAAVSRRVRRERYAVAVLARWPSDRAELSAAIERLRDVDLTALGDDQLLQHWQAVRSFFDDALYLHFELHGALCFVLSELAFAARDLLGWNDHQVLELLAGLSTTSTEPAERLQDLVAAVEADPRLRAAVEAGDFGSIREQAPEFAAMVDDYQRRYGIRALRYEVAEVTLLERPDLLFATIKDMLRSGYASEQRAAELAAQRARGRDAAGAALAGRSREERERFERSLYEAEAAYGVREENEFYTVSVPMALTRFALLELGRRMAARGQIARRDDIFYLEIDEALAAFGDGSEQRALVERRKREEAWVKANPGPASYGQPPSAPPDLSVLPAEARANMEAMFWYTDHIMSAANSSKVQAPQATEMSGLSAAPGVYRGPARVVRGEHEFDKIEAGDVLVCPITSPVWSVLFARIGALVTDTGGILSHPAIIAREYRIPGVVGTGNATEVLRDGQIVEVDGTTGNVRIV